jgi:hypothetical protein
MTSKAVINIKGRRKTAPTPEMNRFSVWIAFFNLAKLSLYAGVIVPGESLLPKRRQVSSPAGKQAGGEAFFLFLFLKESCL